MKKLTTPRDVWHIRQSLGLSQAGFAQLVGVVPNTVARWERGELGMRRTTARLIPLAIAQREADRQRAEAEFAAVLAKRSKEKKQQRKKKQEEEEEGEVTNTLIAAIYARKSTEQNGVADEAKSVTRGARPSHSAHSTCSGPGRRAILAAP